MRKITEEGVHFRSHLDGSPHLLTPEKVVSIQEEVGSDIAMVLDECIPYPSSADYVRTSTERTVRWAERSLRARKNEGLALFGIVPVAERKLELTTAGGARVTRKDSGLGDIRAFARYTAYKLNMPGQTFRIAPFAGTLQAWAGSVHRFQVNGLACPFCSYGIEKQLKAIPGVSRIKISIKTSTVTVTMSDGARLTMAQADRAVKAAGFTMRNFR